MKRRTEIFAPPEDDPDFQMGPFIDIVFLLLVYFMVTSTIQKAEADLGIRLPGLLTQSRVLKMPDLQVVEISRDNRVFLNGREFPVESDGTIPDLVATLARFKVTSDAAKTDAILTIRADPNSMHERSVDVLNSCAEARIKNVSFAM